MSININWLSWLPFGHVPAINATELAQQYQQLLIIDVRTRAEWKKSHIPGSVSIPLYQFSVSTVQQLTTDKAIICICLSAHRSKPATRKLIQAGFDARELQGGMRAWWKLKLPTE